MVDKANNLREKYHNNVIKTWSDNVYKKYKNSPWRWADLPFRDYINEGDLLVNEYLNQTLTKKVEGKSILEIGSAMGSAYKFMKNSGLIDLSNYTGIEVSKVGIDFCKENYPEATWIHKDFTTIDSFISKDFVFERNAIHHMPDPIKSYEKLLKNTNVAFSTCFRSCLKGKSISDLEISYFKSTTGIYYSTIINLFDIVELGLKNGFGNIKITYGGKHEKISNDKKSGHYIDSKINQKDIFLSRCKVFMIKTDFIKYPNFTLVARPDIALKNISAMFLIKKELNKLKKKYSK